MHSTSTVPWSGAATPTPWHGHGHMSLPEEELHSPHCCRDCQAAESGACSCLQRSSAPGQPRAQSSPGTSWRAEVSQPGMTKAEHGRKGRSPGQGRTPGCRACPQPHAAG